MDFSFLSFISSNRKINSLGAIEYSTLMLHLPNDLTNLVLSYYSSSIKEAKHLTIISKKNNRKVICNGSSIVYTDLHGTPEFNEFKNKESTLEPGYTKVISEGGIQKTITREVITPPGLSTREMEELFVKENVLKCLMAKQDTSFPNFIFNKFKDVRRMKYKRRMKSYLYKCGYTHEDIVNVRKKEVA